MIAKFLHLFDLKDVDKHLKTAYNVLERSLVPIRHGTKSSIARSRNRRKKT